ncbi:MAG: hypothetical protein HC828_04685 [Blastochloris sp.]|nr:hypothetical protein [Blastochloris sp.]
MSVFTILQGRVAPFGFTGELHDGDLVHLRARWYHPSIGTFTSRDPFAGFDTLPYSLHPYQYAYSNPVLLTDPSGAVPDEPQQSALRNSSHDLTRWLYDEMIHNLKDPYLQLVRRLNTGKNDADDYNDCTSGGLVWGLANIRVQYVIAGLQFYGLVADQHQWDFKHKIKSTLGKGITLCSKTRCRNNIKYNMPGNIHFGFVAGEAGYHIVFAQIGAAVAQSSDPGNPAGGADTAWAIYQTDYGLSLNVGDEPGGNKAVTFGHYLYRELYLQGLFTFERFQMALDLALDDFEPHSPTKAVNAGIRPPNGYPVGYFNGYKQPNIAAVLFERTGIKFNTDPRINPGRLRMP